MQRWIPISFSLVLGAAVAATPARAGNLVTAHFGGEQGNVTSDHLTTIYFNPAGLALARGWRIYVEGDVAWRTASYDRSEAAISNVAGDGEAGTPSDALDVNAGEATLSNIAAAPFLGAATDFGVPNLGVGVAFYVPFGGQASWDKNEKYEGDARFPGAEDGPQRWFDIHGQLRSLYLTVAGAYRLPGPRLSFGAGVNFTQSNIWQVRARTPQGTDDVVGASGSVAEGRSLLKSDGFAVAASAGVNWEAVPDVLWIAASYQSQPGFGNNTQSGELTNKFGAGASSTSKIRVEQEMPDIVRLGFRYQATPELEIHVAGDFQHWSLFNQQCILDASANPDAKCQINPNGTAYGPDMNSIILSIPRKWKDTYGVQVGGAYWVMPSLELQGGVLFDTASVPDSTLEASLADQNKLFVRAGVRWAVMPDQLLLTLAANNAFYFTRTVGTREQGRIGTLAPSTIPDGAGTYKQNVLFFNLGAEYRF